MGEGLQRAFAAAAATRERYRLKQGGIPVAWSEGSNALAEIRHYALVYGQDGPVMIEHHRNGKWRRLPPPTTKGN